MRRSVYGLLSWGSLLFLLSAAGAQPPDRPGRPIDREPPPHLLFEALDTNHDGVLSADEIRAAGESLKKLDKNGDGKLTEDELHPQGGPGRPPGREPRRDLDEGGPPDGQRRGADRAGPDRRDAERGPRRPPRGPGGPGRDGAERGERADRGGPDRGGPPSVLPPFVRDELQLSVEQQKQLDELDADVRAKLDKILTADQKRALEQAHRRGPAGPPPGDDRRGPADGRERGRAPGRPGRPGGEDR